MVVKKSPVIPVKKIEDSPDLADLIVQPTLITNDIFGAAT
jgi:hypothetical protein